MTKASGDQQLHLCKSLKTVKTKENRSILTCALYPPLKDSPATAANKFPYYLATMPAENCRLVAFLLSLGSTHEWIGS